jgi:cytochrome c peroxidase
LDNARPRELVGRAGNRRTGNAAAAGWTSRLAALAATLLTACGGGSASTTQAPGTGSAASAPLSAAAALGARIFRDASLSASGRQSCASCHDPARAYAMPGTQAIPVGGADGTVPGFRAVPSLRYLNRTPAFFFDADGTPTAGFDRDGRAATLAEQARRPFLAPHEMANADAAAVVARLSRAAYASEFRALFGAAILDDPDAAFDRLAFAIQRFEIEDPSFAPYTSRFDQFLAGRATLTDAEMRGLVAFNSTTKGHCAGCHVSARGAEGAPPLFTDFTYDNLGVPRNPAIPATADPAYFDLGLCGPDRSDGLSTTRPDLCGAFKVPTLRNVATRHAFFHNGRFTTLDETLRFYVTRDTDPSRWYPTVDGSVWKFDDLPPAYRANVNTTEVPYDRRPGQAPRLSEAEIADLIAFLGTLTDADLR